MFEPFFVSRISSPAFLTSSSPDRLDNTHCSTIAHFRLEEVEVSESPTGVLSRCVRPSSLLHRVFSSP